MKMHPETPSLNPLTSRPNEEGVLDFGDIDAQLKAFEEEERRRLGIEEREPDHWHDANPREFTQSQRKTTTILIGGLTLAHDVLITAACRGLGSE